MNEIFVDYDSCILLRDMGFREPCYSYWWVEGGFYIETNPNNYTDAFDDVVSRPTWLQAIQWLQKKLEVHDGFFCCSVEIFSDDSGWWILEHDRCQFDSLKNCIKMGVEFYNDIVSKDEQND